MSKVEFYTKRSNILFKKNAHSGKCAFKGDWNQQTNSYFLTSDVKIIPRFGKIPRITADIGFHVVLRMKNLGFTQSFAYFRSLINSRYENSNLLFMAGSGQLIHQ